MAVLDLSFNRFTGTLPPQTGSLIALEVAGNSLIGDIPEPFASLYSLNVKFNLLCCEIYPQLLAGALQDLEIAHNYFFGTIADITG